jgi:hypothetical protein
MAKTFQEVEAEMEVVWDSQEVEVKMAVEGLDPVEVEDQEVDLLPRMA